MFVSSINVLIEKILLSINVSIVQGVTVLECERLRRLYKDPPRLPILITAYYELLRYCLAVRLQRHSCQKRSQKCCLNLQK